MPDDRPEILRVFEDQLKPEEHDPRAALGCDVDAFLGFKANWSFHQDIESRIPEDSWMRQSEHYSHHAEWRLQEAYVSACLLAADHFKVRDPIPLDRVCVRIVDRAFGSPYHKSIDGYHYVVIPTGYLASLENFWRTYHVLAVAGEKAPKPAEAQPQRIVSNRLGGASIERCLRSDAKLWTYLLSDVFTDTIFWDAYDGPFFHPEEIAHGLARMAYEVIAGLYSSDGQARRRPSTPLSKKLTRLVLLYVMGHEAAHALLSYEGFQGADKLTTEKLCDLHATMHTPVFIEQDSQDWNLAIDGAAEYAVGPFGFFTMVEARYTIGMVMDMIGGNLKDGTPEVDEWSDRFHEIQTRGRGQVGVLKGVLGEKEPDILDTLDAVRMEIEAPLIGIKMLGTRLALGRESAFESVFDSRRTNEAS